MNCLSVTFRMFFNSFTKFTTFIKSSMSFPVAQLSSTSPANSVKCLKSLSVLLSKNLNNSSLERSSSKILIKSF